MGILKITSLLLLITVTTNGNQSFIDTLNKYNEEIHKILKRRPNLVESFDTENYGTSLFIFQDILYGCKHVDIQYNAKPVRGKYIAKGDDLLLLLKLVQLIPENSSLERDLFESIPKHLFTQHSTLLKTYICRNIAFDKILYESDVGKYILETELSEQEKQILFRQVRSNDTILQAKIGNVEKENALIEQFHQSTHY